MTITQLESWLDWQLKHGSHEFPGADGGTCINEAAVVVAGFSYREVLGITDLPESFCPVISQFALTLNDAMPEGEELNRLRPFAARLSGSSDTRAVIYERSHLLAMAAARDFAPLAIEQHAPEAAARLRSAESPDAALAELETLAEQIWPDNVREAIGAALRALSRALGRKQAIYTAELAAISAARAAAVNDRAWQAAIDALDGVLAIGRQANPVEVAVIKERASAALAHG